MARRACAGQPSVLHPRFSYDSICSATDTKENVKLTLFFRPISNGY
jgi:hypothetical protein